MGGTINIFYILQSLGLTVLFVGLIGFERQRKHKIAGMTTHVLVALGAAALAIIQETMYLDAIAFANENPQFIGNVVLDRQRIIAAVVTGVGFLGTGAILKTNSNVYGLTTASTLWISAIIGIIFGLGQSLLGVIVSIAALLTLIVIKRVFAQPLADYYKGEAEEEENE
ncbi:MAG: MgtC/SapB family protein [Candidatus Izimaplasma sp.]|nr:MgtC/SapB family protein [Candidatus Izimaplasma bacterium]